MTRTPPGYIPLTSHSLSGFNSGQGQSQGGDRPRQNRSNSRQNGGERGQNGNSNRRGRPRTQGGGNGRPSRRSPS